MEKIEGKTLDEWIDQETSEQTVSLWGTELKFKPELCSEVLGDGNQLVYIGSIDQRPYYWLARIDSDCDVESDDFNYEELIGLVEDSFGRHPGFIINQKEFAKLSKKKDSVVSDYDSFEDYFELCEYPRLWWGMGGHWGSIVNFNPHNRARSNTNR